MSMEDAILELAAAMREQAAAQRESNEVQRQTAVGYERAVTAYGKTFGGEGDPAPDNAVQAKAAELAEAREQRVAVTKEAAAQDVKANAKSVAGVKPDAELDAAVEQVEQAAQAALEYKKDVFPVLLQVSKSKGKEALRELLTKYGAKTGDALKADQFASILADGNALLAA